MSMLPGPTPPGSEGPGNDPKRLMMFMAAALGIMTLSSWFAPPQKPKAPAPASTGQVPAAPTPAPDPAQPTPAAPAPAMAAAPEDPPLPETLVDLHGEHLKLTISTHGGRIVHARLPDFLDHAALEKGQKVPVDLVSVQGVGGGMMRFGLEGVTEEASYRVMDQSAQSLTLSREGAGWRVIRKYRFDPATYGLHTEVELTNLTDKPRKASPVTRLSARLSPDEGKGGFLSGAPTDQTTFLCETPEKLTREPAISLKEPVKHPGKVLWLGLDRQYFFAGLVLRDGVPDSCEGAREGDVARMQLNYAAQDVAPGATLRLGAEVYLGPKQEAWLQKTDVLLSNTIDYGWFGMLVRLMLAMLLWFYSLWPNYGAAIFLLTLSVKLLTLPLTQRSYVSMQRMKDLQPRLKEIQTKWAHDKAMQGQKQMELFRAENVSPLGGCLPMLIQMPVWIALYRTLYTSVELYQQPFIHGWIEDLTQKDPYYITPLALGVVMVVQAVLTPQAADNPQMKYMQYGMPVFFTFLMAALPSGLTLYMFFNSILTIVQQLYIKRRFGAPTPAASTAK